VGAYKSVSSCIVFE